MSIEEIIRTYTPDVKIIESIKNLSNRFKNSGLGNENITVAVFAVMAEVNKIRKIKHSERRQLAIAIINKFVEDICPGEDTPLELTLKQVVPPLIEQLEEMKIPLKCNCFA